MLPRLRRPALPLYPADFNVYYTASMLVRQGNAAQLYTGADTGLDPQKAIASPGTPIYEAARAQGLPFVGLYVYPPVLADLLLPFTLVPLASATHLWLLTNLGLLLLTGLLVVQLLDLPLLSLATPLILLALLCFTPALQCLVDGQITILLLLLWAAGMVLYKKDHTVAAAALFALATAIKLTPALILLPFLLWRKWRFVGAFLTSLLGLAALALWIDTPTALHTYATRVLPAMSGSIPYFTNYSIPAATQRFITLWRSGAVPPFPPAMPPGVMLAGRAAAAAILLGTLALIARAGHALRTPEQLMVLGLLSLMAPILSPVSWFHAYATAFLAFALLWRECFTRSMPSAYLIALTVVTLLLGSAVSENLMPLLLLSGRHPVLACCLQLGQLLAATAVVFGRLWHLRDTDNSNPQATLDRPALLSQPLPSA